MASSSSDYCITESISKLNEKLKEQEVDENFLSLFKIDERMMNSNSFPSYTFTSRVTHDKLINKFALTFKKLEDDFKKYIDVSLNELLANIQTCQKIDRILGADSSNIDDMDEIEENDIIKAKDGSHKLKCPLQHCKTTTFKLKRHLREIHNMVSSEQLEFASQISQKMERNKGTGKMNKFLDNKKEKVKRESHIGLVERKFNYKECVICKNLYLNLSDHVVKVHLISRADPKYDEYVKQPPVIPKCYTKSVNGRTIKLCDEELKEAIEKFSEVVETQEGDLASLKQLRAETAELREKMKVALNEEEHSALKEDLKKTQDKYFQHRYPDNRKYTTHTILWRDAYIKYLDNQNNKDSKRLQRMAFDVFLPYQEDQNMELTVEHISNARFVRKVLLHFRRDEKKSSSSKIKYLAQFSGLIEFLLISVDSPLAKDNETPEEVNAKLFALKQIETEIRTETVILNKLKGSDLIRTKEQATRKLMTDEELNELLHEMNMYMVGVLKDTVQGKHLNYSMQEILKIRNSLMAAATVRIGRRSLEITKMTLDEVNNKIEDLIEGKKHFTINVAQQKNTSSGKPAPVVFNETEYKLLIVFIRDLRPKIIGDNYCKIVFPASIKSNSKVNHNLGLSAAYKILQKFETKTGKKISSRAVRGSKVTNSRKKNYSDVQLNHLANSMSHSRRTADNYYNFNSLQTSVVHTLSDQLISESSTSTFNITETSCSTSTPIKSYHQLHHHDISITGSPIISPAVTPCSSPSHSTVFSRTNKRNSEVLESSEEEADSGDVTMKTLRTKKIKNTKYDHASLSSSIKTIIEEMKKEGIEHLLRSKSGQISIVHINRKLPNDLKCVSAGIIRDTVKALL